MCVQVHYLVAFIKEVLGRDMGLAALGLRISRALFNVLELLYFSQLCLDALDRTVSETTAEGVCEWQRPKKNLKKVTCFCDTST